MMEYATRVVLEIGYHAGDLPATILKTIHEVPMAPGGNASSREDDVSAWFGGIQGFLYLNEGRASMRERVSVPYTWQTLKGDQVMRIAAAGVHIPYLEQDRAVGRPDLTECTRAELQFGTSALDFFFPYASEQRLLKLSERQYLQSLRSLVVENQGLLRDLTAELREGVRDSFVWEHGVAELICWSNSERLMSLKICHGSKIITSHGQVIQYQYPDGLFSLSKVAPAVRRLALRVRCAANLQALWYRLRLYHRVKGATLHASAGEEQRSYPAPTEWCDDVSSAYRRLGKAAHRPFKCPGAAGDRCHYAMNLHYRADSPGDMVLLFETKLGWNQHGGPELFTFDNHDPAGGLVLLNDGTVKFIRTEEELKQLRWK